MPNRLASELSPYLLQHKDNPVDWYPWGEAAFARARDEDRPIFLSVGYSTCHWCHVMEHESFEHAGVAAALNRDFVSIKVDREERPDIDRVYMTFVQATTGSGGWPMSVWLTPGLEPFYGGTYFPPTSRWGRPGFLDVLTEIARVWREERARVTRSAATILERLRGVAGGGSGDAVPGPEWLDRAVDEFATAFDRRRGGFGSAPKFPRPSELLFLLHEFARTGRDEPRAMAVATLRAMAGGGLRDHVGGGFHRYAVDGDWRVPHFEKMLYDQAQLVLAYVDAAQATGDVFHSGVAIDTLEYVRRDLTDGGGGFYSAEDADSVPPEQASNPEAHKTEGAFYIWRADEIQAALGADADVYRLRFGILPDGNAPADPQREFAGKNLLYLARTVAEVAAETRRPVDEVETVLSAARVVLHAVRARRPRPHLDDKVLTAWNGLMIAAFARAARSLPDGERFLPDARRAATFIRDTLWDADRGTLLRRYRAGDAGVPAYAEDHACLVFGLLELFQADGDPGWLGWALAVQQRQDERFWDDSGGGWFNTTGDDPSVLLRLKDDHDGAEPAASSIGARNLLTLAHLVTDADAGRHGYAARAVRTLAMLAGRGGAARAVPMMLSVLSTYHAGVAQIVVVDGDDGDAAPLLEVVRRHYLPAAIVLRVRAAYRQALEARLPWIGPLVARDGRATAYVCRGFACSTPAVSPGMLHEQLTALTGARAAGAAAERM